MPVTGVSARQRVRALLPQYLKMYRCLFVGGRVGNLVGITAGQTIHRFFHGVHRHVKLPALDASGHHRLRADYRQPGNGLVQIKT